MRSSSRSSLSSPSQVTEPLLFPVTTKSTPRSWSGRRSTLAFFGTAAITGLLVHVLVFGLGQSEVVRQVPIVGGWLPSPPPPPLSEEVCSASGVGGHKIELGIGGFPEKKEDLWPLERVRKMVAKTKGYYARDYSLGLGWNNVRHLTGYSRASSSVSSECAKRL